MGYWTEKSYLEFINKILEYAKKIVRQKLEKG